MRFVLNAGLVLLFAAAPSSSNYVLRNYDFGNGGTDSSTSTNYKLNGTAGTQNGAVLNSTTYTDPNGLNNSQNTGVPAAPTFTNPSNYYDRLRLVLNPGNAPADTKYLIAVSSDSFATTYYVQADNSIGMAQSLTSYQTYTAWGGATGVLVTGLSPSLTYTVKVKALQGAFTGSPFGPTASAATVAPSLTMSLTTTLTSTPPFAVSFTSLAPATVVSGNADALVGLTSNANNGGMIYVRSANAGLSSSSAATSIASASADLTAATTGYGAQVTAASQAAGGPLTSQSPFNGATNNVGILSTNLQQLLTTAGPITTGTATVRLKAKAAATTPSASDYSDTLTFIAAMNF